MQKRKWSTSQRRKYNRTIQDRKDKNFIISFMTAVVVVPLMFFIGGIFKGCKWVFNKLISLIKGRNKMTEKNGIDS